MGGMEDIPLEMFDKIMANNVRSNHILTNLVLPQMKARNDGSIIIVSSKGGCSWVDKNRYGKGFMGKPKNTRKCHLY